MVLAVLTSFDGGRLFGEVYGAGAPRVLALHGWARDHHDFDLLLGGSAGTPGAPRIAAAGQGVPAGAARPPGSAATAPGGPLARSASDLELPGEPLAAIALDLPGFGATPPPGEGWTTPEYAKAVAPLLEANGGPVVLVGHSFGGRVAVHLAAERPDQVEGVVLTGAPLYRPGGAGSGRSSRPPLKYRAARLLARSGLLGADRLEQLRQRYGSSDYRAATGVMRDVLVKAIAEEREEAYTPSLRALTCPLELVWGALDTASPPAVAERIAAAVTCPVNLVVLPDVGHMTPFAAPGHLRAAIERLLAR